MGVQKHELSQQALAELAQLQRGPREKSIFRRNNAKGPNPLSVRKKKKGASDGARKQAAQEDAEQPKRKRARVRKREKAQGVQPEVQAS